MKATTLVDVLRVLNGIGGEEIVLDEEMRLQAKHSIEEMVRLG